MNTKLYIILSVHLLVINAFSQEEKPLNNAIYDNQPYHFGFTLGVSNTKFQINYNNNLLHQAKYDQILSKYSPGFNVGIIMDMKIGQNSNIRITPSFNFTDQKIYYIENNIEDIHPSGNTGISNFETPIYLKYRSDRINNGRAYILIGGNFMLDLSSTEELSQNQSLEFHKTNYSADIGFGIDVYFAFFKFSPEIKYSYGLKNMLKGTTNEINNMINRLSTRCITISLTFE